MRELGDFNFSDTVRLIDAFSFVIFGRVLFDYSADKRAFDKASLRSLIERSVFAFRPFFKESVRADIVVSSMIEKIDALRSSLYLDAESILSADPAATDMAEVIMCYPGFYAIFCYRIAHELYRLGVPILPRFICERAHSLTGIDIHPGATIGARFSIDHGTGVVIGETAVIGNGVRVYQGVTIGAKNFPKDKHGNFDRSVKRHPTIEDGCIIYAGATVLGADTVIGENSVIGANVWVSSSVPPDTVIYYSREDRQNERSKKS